MKNRTSMRETIKKIIQDWSIFSCSTRWKYRHTYCTLVGLTERIVSNCELNGDFIYLRRGTQMKPELFFFTKQSYLLQSYTWYICPIDYSIIWNISYLLIYYSYSVMTDSFFIVSSMLSEPNPFIPHKEQVRWEKRNHAKNWPTEMTVCAGALSW